METPIHPTVVFTKLLQYQGKAEPVLVSAAAVAFPLVTYPDLIFSFLIQYQSKAEPVLVPVAAEVAFPLVTYPDMIFDTLFQYMGRVDVVGVQALGLGGGGFPYRPILRARRR